MRGIKFRVWDKTDKKMVFFDGIFDHEVPYSDTGFGYDEYRKDHKISEPDMFTGIKDITGTDIYENDRVECFTLEHGGNGVVVFYKQSFCVLTYMGETLFSEIYGGMKVIGNIHEGIE